MLDMLEMSDKGITQGKDTMPREIEILEMITPLNQTDHVSQVVNVFISFIFYRFINEKKKKNKELKKEGYSESNMEECPFQVLAESESEISYYFYFF